MQPIPYIKKSFQDFFLIFGSAFVTAFFSEMFFLNEGVAYSVTQYRENPLQLILYFFELGLWYSCALAPVLLIISYFKVNDIWSLFIVGCIFGFLTEGLVVPAIYFELPFSLLWVAASWHPLICFMMGWWYLRLCLNKKNHVQNAFIYAGLGLVWGIWSTYLIGEAADAETQFVEIDASNTHKRIDIDRYFFFTLATTAMLFAGNVILDRWATRKYLPQKAQKITILLLIIALYFIMVLSVGILALILPLALIIFLFLLNKNKQAETESVLENFSPAPISKHFLVFIMPFTATLSYHVMALYDLKIEAYILAWPIIIIGIFMLIMSSIKILRRKTSSH